MSRLSQGLPAAALTLAAVIGGAATAQAQGLVQTQKLSAPLANELVGESVAQCAQKGYTVTAVVVELDGVRQAPPRGDGGARHTLATASSEAHSGDSPP